MDIFAQLIVLLALAKILGELSERIALPSFIGYIAAGIIAGPVYWKVSAANDIALFAQLGMLLLLFMIGFREGNVHELLKSKGTIAVISIAGYLFPFIAAVAIGILFKLRLEYAILLALAVSTTSIAVTVKALADWQKLNTNIGRTILGVTVADNIVSLLAFALIVTSITVGAGAWGQIEKVILSILSFFILLIFVCGAVPWLISKTESLTVEEGQFTFAIIFMLLLAVMAEGLQVHSIIGAFLAGIILSRTLLAETDFLSKLSAIAHSIFVPLFFVWTGLLFQPSGISWLAVAVVVCVLAANYLGAYLGGRAVGISHTDGVAIGFAMLPRGDINIIIASIVVTLVDQTGQLMVPKLIANQIMVATILLILVSTFLAPVLLKLRLRNELYG